MWSIAQDVAVIGVQRGIALPDHFHIAKPGLQGSLHVGMAPLLYGRPLSSACTRQACGTECLQPLHVNLVKLACCGSWVGSYMLQPDLLGDLEVLLTSGLAGCPCCCLQNDFLSCPVPPKPVTTANFTAAAGPLSVSTESLPHQMAWCTGIVSTIADCAQPHSRSKPTLHRDNHMRREPLHQSV